MDEEEKYRLEEADEEKPKTGIGTMVPSICVYMSIPGWVMAEILFHPNQRT